MGKNIKERGDETIEEIYDNLAVLKKITEQIIEKYNRRKDEKIFSMMN